MSTETDHATGQDLGVSLDRIVELSQKVVEWVSYDAPEDCCECDMLRFLVGICDSKEEVACVAYKLDELLKQIRLSEPDSEVIN